jgi:tRNA pseudouridine55 synthase
LINFNEGNTLLIDKPLEWSSFHVVKKIRYLTKAKKVGHAGTLDPLATGLLIICTGKFTKRLESFQAKQKTYTGVFKLGATTPSYDRESEEDAHFEFAHIKDEDLYEAANAMTGELEQVPPIFSAVKINGERAYAKARKGEKPVLKSRIVTIAEFKITNIDLPFVSFEIACSKGTYIRSMANDFGKRLKSGGYLHELRRTKIGDHDVKDAQTIEEFEAFIKKMQET